LDTWSKTVQVALDIGPARVSAAEVNPQQLVDQAFEFAESMLAMQRDLTRTIIEKSVALQQGLATQSPASEAKDA
jgi:hypothetical protein